MLSTSRSTRIHITAWLLGLLLVSLGGCGFQPRGQGANPAAIPGPIYISGIRPFSDLHREIERQLNASGTTLAASAGEGATVLRIEKWDSDSRVLSVNSRNKAVEFELEESARFSLRATDGRELVAEQTARVLRIQFRPESAVLGSDREADLLRDDMRRDLVSQILRRISAQR